MSTDWAGLRRLAPGLGWEVGETEPPGWRIVHHDFLRDVYTLERTRRFFKGAYRVVLGEDMPILFRPSR
jgi:hypothetical protein